MEQYERGRDGGVEYFIHLMGGEKCLDLIQEVQVLSLSVWRDIQLVCLCLVQQNHNLMTCYIFIFNGAWWLM